MTNKERLNKLIDNIILSRKFICLIIFVILRIHNYITGTELLVVAGIFMGNNALEKVLRYKERKNNNGEK